MISHVVSAPKINLTVSPHFPLQNTLALNQTNRIVSVLESSLGTEEWTLMYSRDFSKINLQILLAIKISTIYKYENTVEQSNKRFKLNKKLFKLGVRQLGCKTEMCIYPASTHTNANNLSCNMPEYKGT